MKLAARRFAIKSVRTAVSALGLAVILSVFASLAHADAPKPAPEVDPGSLASALTLLVGGAMTLTGRIRRGR